MADSKKISELHQISNLNTDDEFLVVDKSTKSGTDASDTGKTSRVTFDQLKNQIGSHGQKGEPGQPGHPGGLGDKGPRGAPGEDSNVKGPRGEDGAKGNQSTVKGPRGEDSNVKGPRGEEGAKGNQSTVKGPRGEEGAKGEQGTSGPKGSTSSVNETLSLVKSDSLSWDSTKNKISKLADGGSWNAQVFSNVGFSTFNLSFSPGNADKHMAMGVSLSGSSSLHDTHLDRIFLGFYLKDDGTFDVLNQGTKINKDSFEYHEGSIFNLAFDKLNFTITLDGHEVANYFWKEDAKTDGKPPAYVYSLDSSFYDTGTNLTEFISFTPGAKASQGPAGRQGPPGPKGQKGEPSTVRGPKGSTGAPSTVKGPKGSTGAPSTVKGPKGSTGAPSTEKGPKGNESTVRGPKGPEGAKGPTGDQSHVGTAFIGMIAPSARINPPRGWMDCDGRTLSKSKYPNLFNAIGYSYGGSGDAFNIPDLRGRVVAGQGSAERLTGIDETTIGQFGGSATHKLTEAEMPSHRHKTRNSNSDSGHGRPATGGNAAEGNGWHYSQYVGGSMHHNNVQPTMILKYIIRYENLDDADSDPAVENIVTGMTMLSADNVYSMSLSGNKLDLNHPENWTFLGAIYKNNVQSSGTFDPNGEPIAIQVSYSYHNTATDGGAIDQCIAYIASRAVGGDKTIIDVRASNSGTQSTPNSMAAYFNITATQAQLSGR